jgi:hypothetical protein
MLIALTVILPFMAAQPDYIQWGTVGYSTDVFSPRWSPNCAEFNTNKNNKKTVYLHGGKATNPTTGNPIILGDVWVSRDGAKSWQQRAPKKDSQTPAPYTANGGLSLLQNKRLISFGGLISGINDGYDASNSVFWSTDEGMSWNKNEDAPWSTRYNFASVTIPNSNIIVMTGGFVRVDRTDNPVAETWLSFDGYGKEWTARSMNSEFGTLAMHSMNVVGDAIKGATLVVVGGFDNSINGDYQGFTSAVYASTNMGAKWSKLNAAPGFAPRFFAQLVEFESILYYFGGQGIQNPDSSVPANGLMVDSGAIVFKDTWYSLDSGLTWQQNPPNIGMEYRFAACASVLKKGELVYFTGTLDENSGVSDVQIASLATTDPKFWQHWKSVNQTSP